MNFSFSALLPLYFHDSGLFRECFLGRLLPCYYFMPEALPGASPGFWFLARAAPVFLDSWGRFTQNPPALQSPAWGRAVVILESQQVAL